jgi:hypothetical protein
VVGYASGGFDIRAPDTGDVIVQDKFADPIAGFAVVRRLVPYSLCFVMMLWSRRVVVM